MPLKLYPRKIFLQRVLLLRKPHLFHYAVPTQEADGNSATLILPVFIRGKRHAFIKKG